MCIRESTNAISNVAVTEMYETPYWGIQDRYEVMEEGVKELDERVGSSTSKWIK